MCHRTFSGDTAFDAHRRGGECLRPEDVGLVAVDKPWGVMWGYPRSEKAWWPR